MKYSIIIPCYKEDEEIFRRCLDSIKNQTLQPYEVICVDDCSPIETPKIAKEYEFTYIRHEKNYIICCTVSTVISVCLRY